jgi:hypothetical protein
VGICIRVESGYRVIREGDRGRTAAVGRVTGSGVDEVHFYALLRALESGELLGRVVRHLGGVDGVAGDHDVIDAKDVSALVTSLRRSLGSWVSQGAC